MLIGLCHCQETLWAVLFNQVTVPISAVEGGGGVIVCSGLTSLLNIQGHIATVSACSSGTLTNVLSHMNAMPQTQDMAIHPVTVYRHKADLSLCYPLV